MMTGPGKGNVRQATEFDCLGTDAVACHGNSDQGKRNDIISPCSFCFVYFIFSIFFIPFVDHVHAKLAV